MLSVSRYRGGGVGDLKGRGLEIGHSYDKRAWLPKITRVYSPCLSTVYICTDSLICTQLRKNTSEIYKIINSLVHPGHTTPGAEIPLPRDGI